MIIGWAGCVVDDLVETFEPAEDEFRMILNQVVSKSECGVTEVRKALWVILQILRDLAESFGFVTR